MRSSSASGSASSASTAYGSNCVPDAARMDSRADSSVWPRRYARSVVMAALEGADPLDALALQRVERIGRPRPADERQLGVELDERRQHEPPMEDVAVGQPQPLGLVLHVVQQ